MISRVGSTVYSITTLFKVLLANCLQQRFHNTVFARMTGTVTVAAVESGIDFIGLGTPNSREPVPKPLDHPHYSIIEINACPGVLIL